MPTGNDKHPNLIMSNFKNIGSEYPKASFNVIHKFAELQTQNDNKSNFNNINMAVQTRAEVQEGV